MDVQHPPTLKRVTVHKAAPQRKLFLTAALVLLYAYAGNFVYSTVGQPLAEAIAQTEELEKTGKIQPKLSAATQRRKAEDLAAQLMGEAGLGEGEEDEFGAKKKKKRKKKKKKKKKAKKNENETATEANSTNSGPASPYEDEEKPLPPWYLPDAWAVAALFGVCTLHALFFLLCRWLTWFKALALYEPASRNEAFGGTGDCWVHVVPQQHRGRPAIARITRSQVTQRLGFVFQRQAYELLEAKDVDRKRRKEAEQDRGAAAAAAAQRDSGGDAEDEVLSGVASLIGAGAEAGAAMLIECPTSLPLEEYVESKGLSSSKVADATLKFGTNKLNIAQPKFIDLYKEQLMSPIAMFQFFTAALWMLDEYWQYTLFNIFNVLMFESTTVFQRLKTLTTLNGMSAKPFSVKVYRAGKWHDISSEGLLPGDLVSIKRKRPPPPLNAEQIAAATAAATGSAASGHDEEAKDDAVAAARQRNEQVAAAAATAIVPCDCLILRGDAVVNEATLTGESTPLMKDAIQVAAADASRVLEMDGKDRMHVLFSGTSLISTLDKGSGNDGGSDELPRTPDSGCLCYVLRTGFSSSQGELLQMIEFSTENVSGDSRETLYALLVLLIFALVAAGYVLTEGLKKGNRTTHELLLKCVIIITSVVPRQLPMQMALAVNTALMSLFKTGIFCTEPYRVPFAGKVSHCLFDKTGTLTTDQLIPVGVVSRGAAALEESHDDADGALGAGDVVDISGLKGAAELNGKTGTIVKHDEAAGRFTVAVDGRQVRIKGANLCRAANAVVRSAGASVEEGEDASFATARAETGLVPVSRASQEAAMVLAGCHALVSVSALEQQQERAESQGKSKPKASQQQQQTELIGDPIELAGLRGVEWSYEAVTQTATPGTQATRERAIFGLEKELSEIPPRVAGAHDTHRGKRAELAGRIAKLRKQLSEQQRRVARAPVASVRIVHRFHFDSKLQRMSVYAIAAARPGAALEDPQAAAAGGACCLVKGSPEMVQSLLRKGAVPAEYDETYRRMAERGMRVLALAFKWGRAPDSVVGPDGQPSRAWAESELEFAGFVAFACRTRADSPVVVAALRQSAHGVAMVTGDAALTALHVAREVGILEGRPRAPLLLKQQDETHFDWVIATGRDRGTVVSALGTGTGKDGGPGLRALVTKGHALCATESVLEAAAEATGGALWSEVDAIEVLARMSPQGKARVARAIQEQEGFHVLMCGDGGNDVGALKQADVGIALLGGHGNANTDAGAAAGDKTAEGQGQQGSVGKAEQQLNAQDQELKKKSQRAAHLRKTLLAAKQKELMAKQQEWLKEELDARGRRGEDVGFMGSMQAMKAVAFRLKNEMQRETAEINRKHGNVLASADDKDLLAEMGGDAGMLPVVRPGDASVAAPFTTRIPSVRSCVDLIRQGRCTLLSALQQQQIMMLECIISAYTLSALSLEGARSSERQMMASGWLLMTASLAFSYSSAIPQMHPVRPLRSLFHPAIWVSIAGQAAMHLMCMRHAVRMATEEMGPELLKEVLEFHKRVRAGEQKESEGTEDDPLAEFWTMWSQPFKPNLLNTCVFLVETAQMVAVLLVNYKGRPWMKGIIENHALCLSLFLCVAGVGACAWSISPMFNGLIHLEPFPNDEFRWQVMGLVGISLAGTFIWDRFCTFLFARPIFNAMVEQAKQTRPKDLVPMFYTLLKVFGGLVVLGTGNILVLGGLGWWYYKKKSAAPPPE